MGFSLAETTSASASYETESKSIASQGQNTYRTAYPKASDQGTTIKSKRCPIQTKRKIECGNSSLGAFRAGAAPLRSARPSPAAAGPRSSHACAVHPGPDCCLLPHPRAPRLQSHSAQQQPHTRSAVHPIRLSSRWVGAPSTTRRC